MPALSRTQLNQMLAEVNAELKKIGDRNGVNFKSAKCTFDPSGGTFNVRVEGYSDQVEAPEAQDYERVRESRNLPAIKSTFTFKGEQFRIIGWRKWATTYPVLCERVVGGKKSSFPVEYIYREFGLRAPMGGLTLVPTPPMSKPASKPGNLSDDLLAPPLK